VKTWKTWDKTGWGEGPWLEEADKVEWRDRETGLPCLIVRNRLGSLCGYVGVPHDHPLYGSTRLEDDAPDVEVHGGVNYSGPCDGDEATGICHVPRPGESDDVWWFGFDCGHIHDYSPAFEMRQRELAAIIPDYPVQPDGFGEWQTYKTVGYVTNEVTGLALQLHAIGKGH